MQVDAVFSFAKVYNIDKKIDVVVGQEFKLNTDLTGSAKWFSDNDPVLGISVTDTNASLTAASTGTSTVLIMGTDFGILKEIVITVVEDTEGLATGLNATAGDAILK